MTVSVDFEAYPERFLKGKNMYKPLWEIVEGYDVTLSIRSRHS